MRGQMIANIIILDFTLQKSPLSLEFDDGKIVNFVKKGFH